VRVLFILLILISATPKIFEVNILKQKTTQFLRRFCITEKIQLPPAVCFAACFTDICRNKFYAIDNIQRFSCLAVVSFAQRNYVPTTVVRAIFLNMRAYFWLGSTIFLGAIIRKRLTTEFFPMI
jgi:hypothetical protein